MSLICVNETYIRKYCQYSQRGYKLLGRDDKSHYFKLFILLFGEKLMS